MTFHTALSTAFPQPAPGGAPSPGPMLVSTDRLRSKLWLSTVTVMQGNKPWPLHGRRYSDDQPRSQRARTINLFAAMWFGLSYTKEQAEGEVIYELSWEGQHDNE
jgi:hypothetical protein